MEDQARHGLNSTTLYGGFDTLPMAAKAGMTRAPCLMHWPGGNAQEQIEAARKSRFDGLLYYGGAMASPLCAGVRPGHPQNCQP